MSHKNWERENVCECVCVKEGAYVTSPYSKSSPNMKSISTNNPDEV